MNTLSSELRGIIGRHLEAANAQRVLAIASALCTLEQSEMIGGAPTKAGATPQARFEFDSTTVRDHQTGLIWTRDNVPGGRMSWKDAQAAAAKLTIGASSDWRLPTIRELLTLVDYGRTEPAIDSNAFPTCEPNYYWSSTPLASSPGGYAWGVYFYSGYALWYGQDVFGLRPRGSPQSVIGPLVPSHGI